MRRIFDCINTLSSYGPDQTQSHTMKRYSNQVSESFYTIERSADSICSLKQQIRTLRLTRTNVMEEEIKELEQKRKDLLEEIRLVDKQLKHRREFLSSQRVRASRLKEGNIINEYESPSPKTQYYTSKDGNNLARMDNDTSDLYQQDVESLQSGESNDISQDEDNVTENHSHTEKSEFFQEEEQNEGKSEESLFYNTETQKEFQSKESRICDTEKPKTRVYEYKNNPLNVGYHWKEREDKQTDNEEINSRNIIASNLFTNIQDDTTSFPNIICENISNR